MIKIKFLGTASGAPVSGRFPASLLIEREGKKMLVDCGEGIQYQLFKSGTGLRGLETIFVTHMHGDHVLGLPGFFMTLSLMNWDRPLDVYGPQELEAFLTFTLRSTYGGLDVLEKVNFHDISLVEEFEVGEMKVKPFPAVHRIPAYGLVVEERERPGAFNVEKALSLGVPRGPLWGKLQRGRPVEVNGREVLPQEVLGPPRKGAKVVITGDSAPSEEVVRRAEGADCLVHDAAFPRGYEEEAHLFGHSTWYDAVQVASKAGVRLLVLYNFGGRAISEIENIREESKKLFNGALLASDLDEVVIDRKNLRSLALAPSADWTRQASLRNYERATALWASGVSVAPRALFRGLPLFAFCALLALGL